jgi:putative nucleotidyltransferase with HDIG domain
MAAVWHENLWFAPALILSGLIGAFLGETYTIIGPVGVAVFVAPVLVLRYSFTLYTSRTERSIAELEQAKAKVEETQREKERTLDQLIVTVAAIIDARDRSVAGHSRQVARYAVALAEELGLPVDLVQRIRISGLLHDLGKIGVPESILHKPGRLTADEFGVVQEHAGLGQQILAEVWALQDVARMVGEHHEQFGGGGYPTGKSGEAISIGGRILAVSDTLDSILSDRPYSRAKPLAWALEEISRCAGTQFDPAVVQALLRLVEKREPGLFINSSRSGDDRVRTLFPIPAGRVRSESAGK